MSLRVSSKDHTAQIVHAITVSAGSNSTPNVPNLFNTSTGNWANTGTHTLAINWYCEELAATNTECIIAEFSNGTDATVELRYVCDGSGVARLDLYIDGTLIITGSNFATHPYQRWVGIAIAYQKITDAATSRYTMTTWMHGDSAAPTMNAATAGSTAGLSIATTSQLALGKRYSALSGANRNALGVPMIWVTRELVADGSVLLGSVTSIDIRTRTRTTEAIAVGINTDLAGFMTQDPTQSVACWNCFACGYTFIFPIDVRPPITNGCVPQFDRNGTSLPYYLTGARTNTFVGTMSNVEPYTHSGITSYPRPVVRTATNGSYAFSDTPWRTRTAGDKVREFVRRALGRTTGGTSQVNVATMGNSRAIYPAGFAPIRLTDGTTVGGSRTLPSNFNDHGLPAQAALWNGGLVGMGNFPPPTDVWAGWGFDCILAAPLVRTAAGAGSTIGTATTSTINTTYTRAWGASREATTVAGATDRYRGSGNPLQINVGYGYRAMIRPENGLPITDALNITAIILNCPSLSDFKTRKEVTASAQDGADTLADSYSATLGNRPSSAALTISATTSAVFTDDYNRSTPGTITVNNTGGQLTANHVGQWAEVLDVSGNPQDLVCIESINNTTPAACVVGYEGLLKNTVTPAVSTLLVNPNVVSRYIEAGVNHAANSVSSGNWRGLDIVVEVGAAGKGVLVCGYKFVNPSRGGVVISHLGRNGCGVHHQNVRMYTSVSPTLGTSPLQEMFRVIDPDVLVLTSATQGTSESAAVTATQMSLYASRATAALPALEVVFAANGPEPQQEGLAPGLYTEAATHSIFHAQMRQSAADTPGSLFVSWYNDLRRGTGAINRRINATTTESTTHPAGEYDWMYWLEQLEDLCGARVRPGVFRGSSARRRSSRQ